MNEMFERLNKVLENLKEAAYRFDYAMNFDCLKEFNEARANYHKLWHEAHQLLNDDCFDDEDMTVQYHNVGAYGSIEYITYTIDY